MADPTVAYIHLYHLGLLATKYGYTRTDVDSYAVDSQKRADNAWKEKRFKKSIINVEDQNQLTILDKDEYMRPNTTMQSLAALDPSFAHIGKNHGFDEVAILKYPDIETIDHVHHAGNSSGIVDGAAAVLIGNKEMGNKYELKPRAKIRSFAYWLRTYHNAYREQTPRKKL